VTKHHAQEVTIPIPLGGHLVYLHGRWPVTPHEWGLIMSILEAMKPGLVQESEPDPWWEAIRQWEQSAVEVLDA
jgi:hypothetical protein